MRGILGILGKIIETESIAKYILLLVVKQYNRLSQPPHILFNYSGFKDSPTHNYLSDNLYTGHLSESLRSSRIL